MSRPVLIATGDQQSLTVSRVTSNYAWGSWDVTVPENTTEVEKDSRIKAGYIYKIKNSTSQGLFDRRFLRSDAKMDMKNNETTLEKVLDNSEKRISGTTTIEREITRDGYGIYKPEVDFKVNDLVDVKIWNKILTLPVRSITHNTTPNAPNEYKIQVGGDKILDAIRLSEKNDEVTKAIIAERKSAEKDIQKVQDRITSIKTSTDKDITVIRKTANDANTTAGKAEEKSTTAITTANNADSEAKKAKTTADNAKTTADNALKKSDNAEKLAKASKTQSDISKDTADKNKELLNNINNSLTIAGLQGDLTTQLTEAAKMGSFSQSWVNSNQAKWNELQTAWNSEVDGWRATQEKINENNLAWQAQQEYINNILEENDKLLKDRFKMLTEHVEEHLKEKVVMLIFRPNKNNTFIQDNYIYVNKNFIGLKESFIGEISVTMRYSGNQVLYDTYSVPSSFNYDSSAGYSVVNFKDSFNISNFDSSKIEDATITYTRKNRDMDTSTMSWYLRDGSLIPRSTWEEVGAVKIKPEWKNIVISGQVNIDWKSSHYFSEYGLGLMINDKLVGQVGPAGKVGSWTSLKDISRRQTYSFYDIKVPEGASVKFVAYSNSNNSRYRKVSSEGQDVLITFNALS